MITPSIFGEGDDGGRLWDRGGGGGWASSGGGFKGGIGCGGEW